MLTGKKTYLTTIIISLVFGLGQAGYIPPEWQTTIMGLLTGGAFTFLQTGMSNKGPATYAMASGLAVIAFLGGMGMITPEVQLQLTALFTGGAVSSVRQGVGK